MCCVWSVCKSKRKPSEEDQPCCTQHWSSASHYTGQYVWGGSRDYPGNTGKVTHPGWASLILRCHKLLAELLMHMAQKTYNFDNECLWGSSKCWIFQMTWRSGHRLIYTTMVASGSVYVGTSALHFHAPKHDAEQAVIGCFTCPSDCPCPIKAAMESRSSAISLEAWLCETMGGMTLTHSFTPRGNMV